MGGLRRIGGQADGAADRWTGWRTGGLESSRRADRGGWGADGQTTRGRADGRTGWRTSGLADGQTCGRADGRTTDFRR